jgi:hypothetical protein
MGGVGSKDSQSAQGYIEQANKVQQLPNQILHILFSQTDFKDLLALSSVEACPAYIFTTANALETLFQKLDVNPSIGKGGEILFAPVSRLAPGLIQSKESTAAQAERARKRNDICLNVAYYYIRIFQIYSALALSIMNTNPVRRQVIPQKGKRNGPSLAPFMRGGDRYLKQEEPGVYGQRVEARWRTPYLQISNSPFKVLMNYFRFVSTPQVNKIFLKLNEKVESSLGTFVIEWDPTKTVLQGTYANNDKIESPPVKVSIDYTSSNTAILMLNNEPIIEFTTSSGILGWIVSEGQGHDAKQRALASAIHDHFSEFREGAKEGRPVGQGRVGPAITGIVAGKSSFYAFDDLKKLFEDYHKGDPKLPEFPKAYCIARAMTLMNPIFVEERLAGEPFRSQICSKTADNEALKFMPIPGTYFHKNIYFRSLVSLSYESYEYTTKEVNLIQSQEALKKLQDISLYFGKVYRIPGDETTLKSLFTRQVAVKEFDFCKADSVIYFTKEKDDFRKAFLKTYVMPMLQFQNEHNVKVLALLKKMFDIEQGTLKFSKEIVKGGLPAITAIGREAFQLLSSYYSKSEAFYMKGVLALKANRTTGALYFS